MAWAFASLATALVGLCPPALAQTGAQFDGTNDYITFGAATATLGAPSFTLECWFMRTGSGVTTSTGTGGVTALPLLTKGRGEADGSTLDCNWFLGIRGTDSVLVADYEEGTGQTSPGLNHPAAGVTRLVRNVWYHAAATFDGTTWRLYLNGKLDATVVVGASRLPQWLSVQHAALGSALTSTGVAAGYFAGVIDEARVWDHARPEAGLRDSALLELTTAPGLLGRWGLNDGSGTTAVNSVAGSPTGTLMNGPTWVTGSPFSFEYALRFMGSNGYVTFGDPAALDLAQFTIECWFRRDGAGTSISTGSNGISAVPMVTHGAPEADGSTVDMNWFLGLRASDFALAADFEEGATGAAPGSNHPVAGVTPVTTGVWHHAAATYDGSEWRLYLDGNLENSLVVGQPPQSSTIQLAGLATALQSTGAAQGYFNGTLDEVRVWDRARSAAEIQSTINSRLTGPEGGLVARWGLDEGAGTAVASGAGTAIGGTITGTAGSGWTWTGGAPFDIGPPTPPAAPSALVATAITSSLVRLSWTDGSNNETAFEIERSTGGAGGPYFPLASVGAGVGTYDDAGLSATTEYCYRVRAVNTAGVSGYAGPACATTPEVTRTALAFTGTTYVTFGDADAVDLPQFTVECWFRRDAAGVTTTTGTSGVTDAIPLVTNGRGEAEASNVDLNWFLGISDAGDVLAADFEEGAGGSSPSLNHPVFGVTPITLGAWHHAAVTYDGTTWNLYLDGMLENTLYVGQPCASASTQHAAIASALTSTGAAAGYFAGAIDEARVWSHARTLAEIRGAANAEIDAATPGLVARWGLDEGSGTAVGGSAGTAVNGTIMGTGSAWIAPAPFDLAFNDPPALPVLVGPPDAGTGVGTSPLLRVQVSDPDADSVTVTFYGRPVGAAPAPDFTLIGLPDTQYYTAETSGGSNATLKAQTAWVTANRAALDIRYVAVLGDVTDTNTQTEWMRADSAYKSLEDPLATGLSDGIPFGVGIGNHDETPNGEPTGTVNYNLYFGAARFGGRSYYGGHYGGDGDNWYELFSAGGMEFIVVGLEYDTSPDAVVLQWADDLLTANPGRRAIVVTHYGIGTGNPGSWSTQGQAIYNQLKDNPNFFLMLCGHAPGEGRRSDVYDGRTVHTLLSDYQGRANGGSGWLRILQFSPADNVIRVRTYSPTLGQFEADADSSSQFTLAYDMSGAGAAYQVVGTVRVASGEVASITWPGLAPETGYQWYAVVSDGRASRSGPTWTFTTRAANQPPTAQVLWPNGGESVDFATTATLRWNASDDAGVASVSLLLSRSGAAGPYEPLATDIPNTGSFSWLVTPPATTDAWLKVVAHDAEGLSGEDIGDAAFTIVDPATAALLALFEAEPVMEGVRLRWRLVDPGLFRSVTPERADAASGPWASLAAEVGTADGVSALLDRTAAYGRTYYYRLTVQRTGGGVIHFGPLPGTAGMPVTEFALMPAAPNPSSGLVRFTYALPRAADVRLSVYDLQGRELAVLARGGNGPGLHQAVWSGETIHGRAPAGAYFVRLTVAGRSFTRRVVLAR